MPKKRLKYRLSLYKIRNTKLNIILTEGNGGIPFQVKSTFGHSGQRRRWPEYVAPNASPLART
ncbi:hypothetical protein CBM2592_B10125 [Cupriavidus taiwanensis]|nr:hypothetical protein CBM2588_B10123 [Cupriavidus taiwanensis]SOY59861.1 hypothetical protein CBM2592_B10125 [Cupriavidus taiwanensis]SOY91900.1 hypothetical protein CBM2591_B10124 [Cupriavidus taiwanensis]SOZ28630.1 hypothetical protein CBM2608_B140530 [Cupriavidus taiwanensis]SOZ73564.1 hypothetical protein CBM2617_B190127 [Cupriavidus taiwanensis]